MATTTNGAPARLALRDFSGGHVADGPRCATCGAACVTAWTVTEAPSTTMCATSGVTVTHAPVTSYCGAGCFDVRPDARALFAAYVEYERPARERRQAERERVARMERERIERRRAADRFAAANRSAVASMLHRMPDGSPLPPFEGDRAAIEDERERMAMIQEGRAPR